MEAGSAARGEERLCGSTPGARGESSFKGHRAAGERDARPLLLLLRVQDSLLIRWGLICLQPWRRRRLLLSCCAAKPRIACCSPGRDRGGPHLNGGRFPPGRGGLLGPPPRQRRRPRPPRLFPRRPQAEDGLGAPPCPCAQPQPAPPRSPGSAGGGAARLLCSLSSQKGFQRAAPGVHRLPRPPASVPETHTTAPRCSKQSCTPGSGCSDVFQKPHLSASLQ